MVDKSNEYGYIPASPTQSSSSNSGVFGVNDIVGLLTDGKYALQILQAQVVALVHFQEVTLIKAVAVVQEVIETHTIQKRQAVKVLQKKKYKFL